MNCNIGNFIFSSHSKFPSFIISENEDSYLVTIDEYNGDYKWVNKRICDSININPENELSFLLNYGNWFYKQHKDLFNEIIIKNIIYYYNVNK